MVLYSFWWPQIVHSAISGRRHPFHSLYLYGTSVLRFLLPLYVLTCPRNLLVLLVEYFSPQYDLSESGARKEVLDLSGASLLCLYVAAQVLVLQLQSRWGPRFFVPRNWLAQQYDYHRCVPSHLTRGEQAPRPTEEPGIALSLFSSGASRDYRPVPTEEDAEGATSSADDIESGPSSPPVECVICYNPICLHLQQQYMITPCDHLFHEECLRQWMGVKLECPVCRSALPALEEED